MYSKVILVKILLKPVHHKNPMKFLTPGLI